MSYLCTPLTTKGEVARETFYAALFEVYGAQMLSARTEQLFGDDANAAHDVLLANNEKYLKGVTGVQTCALRSSRRRRWRRQRKKNRYFHFTDLWHCFYF